MVPRKRVSVVAAVVGGMLAAVGVNGLTQPRDPTEAVARTSVSLEAPGGQDLPPMGSHKGQRYDRLVIQNAMMISGRGAPGQGRRASPPVGPVDIVIERDRIVDIVQADPVSLGGREGERPTGDRVIDASGMWVLPGLIDMHSSMHGSRGVCRAGEGCLEYYSRLYLGHGVTTIREPNASIGLDMLLEHKRRSEANEVAAPRLFVYPALRNLAVWAGIRPQTMTPEQARTLVREAKERGADGIKFFGGFYADQYEAAVDEILRQGMRIAHHHAIGEKDAVFTSNTAKSSMTIEHWYGVPDAALDGTQRFPPDYNFNDELDRFRYAGMLWSEAAQRPDELSRVIDVLVENGTAWDPTFTVYEANVDLVRSYRLPWRDRFATPELLDYWEPDLSQHGSYHGDWKTSDEVNWRQNFEIWMKYVYEFWRRGGLLTVGSDAGTIHQLYGFSTIREMERLQHAGIHPYDIIKIATTNAAKALGVENELCGIRPGCVADVIVVDGNPLDNLKVLYGGGYAYYGTAKWGKEHGGVRWTIKAGIVFDARELLREVESHVRERWRLVKTSQPNAANR